MEAIQTDKLLALFSKRRRSRRAALLEATGLAVAAGVAATGLNEAAAQESTPSFPDVDLSQKQDLLFVQSFKSGSIAAREGEEGAYTVTLEHGLGETIYFSDRPGRIVGTTPTEQFVRGFSFNPENPPNAALVISNDEGETDIAVVELTNPTFDPATSTATYDMLVLQNFDDFGGTFQADPVDLADVAASFGSAHLLIDDCDNAIVYCETNAGIIGSNPAHQNEPFCYQWGQCQPCLPYIHDSPSPCATWYAWVPVCQGDTIACADGDCHPYWKNGNTTSHSLGCP